MPKSLRRHLRSGRGFRAHYRLAFTLLVGVEIETIAQPCSSDLPAASWRI